MAFLENGSPVATKLGPVATLTTLVNGKQSATQIFTIANTTRVWLAMAQTTAGTYSAVTSTGTATLYVYDTAYDLIQEISVTSTSSSTVIASNFHRIECVASGALDISITPAAAKVTTAGGTMSLDTITASGNYGAGSGNATGGTSGYVAGQLAHVIVAGGSGGGGGAGLQNSPYGQYGASGGAGGLGGIAASTTAFPLTGTYTLVVGSGGNAGSNGNPTGAGGGAGSVSNGFGLQGNAANGGGGANRNTGTAPDGNAGTPAAPAATDIYNPLNTGAIPAAGGNRGTGPFGGNAPQPNAGTAGRILVLRWTP